MAKFGSRRAIALSLFIGMCGGTALCTSPARANTRVFYDNFDGGRAFSPGVAGGFSGYTNTESVQGYAGLGTASGGVVSGNLLYNPTGDNFTNTPSQKSTLVLTGLAAHSSIRLGFLLAIVDTWDGQFNDYMNVDVDGVRVFSESFTNFEFDAQSYSPPPGVQIAKGIYVGFEVYADGLYDMGRDVARFGNIPHTGSTLTIDWYADGPNWNRPANEAWGMDNVYVDLVTVPEPITAAYAGLAIVGLLARRNGPRRYRKA